MLETLLILGICGLVLYILGVLAVIAARNGRLFCFLPINHVACVELNGQFLHFLMYEEDKKKTLDLINMLYPANSGNPEIETRRQELCNIRIIVRDNPLVDMFNLHLLDWNIFASIKTVSVVKKHLVADSAKKDKDISEYVSVNSPYEEKFLRLAWPRTIFIDNLELQYQVKVDVVAQCTEIRLFDLQMIYFKQNGKISEKVDENIRTAFVNCLNALSLDEFQKADLTAKTGTESLTHKMEGGGMQSVGAYIVGAVAVVDWEQVKDPEQDRIKQAQQERAAVEAEKNTAIIRAEGVKQATIIKAQGEAEATLIRTAAEAEGIRLTGLASAEVIQVEGSANAEAAMNMTIALDNEISVAGQVLTAQAVSKPGSSIQVLGNVPVIQNLNKKEDKK